MNSIQLLESTLHAPRVLCERWIPSDQDITPCCAGPGCTGAYPKNHPIMETHREWNATCNEESEQWMRHYLRERTKQAMLQRAKGNR